jgi:undecaprenyl-diphosphatase
LPNKTVGAIHQPALRLQTQTSNTKEQHLNISKRTLAGLGLLGGSLLIFLVIAYAVGSGNSAGFDDPIRNFIYGLRAEGLNTLMEGITYLGNWQSVTIVCLLLLAYDKTRIPFGVLGATVAITDSLVNKGLKMLFERARPDDILPLIEQGGYSFPSGHSVTSMAFYGILLFLVQTRMEDRKKANALSLVLLLLIVLIGPSRIYLGVHYPTDVLAGWAEGVFVATALYMLAFKFVPKNLLTTKTATDITTEN